MVAERLEPRPATSSWQFYDRAEPTSANLGRLQAKPQNYYSCEIEKTDLSDIWDLKKALSKIPKEQKNQAKKLLQEIEQRSPELTFNSKGVIFVDGESLPNSNFFKFLPLLYKKRVAKNPPSFPDFVEKLNAMGLHQYFVLQKKFVAKTKIDNELQLEIKKQDQSEAKNWWVLT